MILSNRNYKFYLFIQFFLYMFFFNKSVPANELEIENSGLSGNKNSKHYDVDSILDEILGMDPLAISLEDDDVQNILNQKNYSFEIILENDSNVFDDTSSPQQSHSTISQFDFFWKYLCGLVRKPSILKYLILIFIFFFRNFLI